MSFSLDPKIIFLLLVGGGVLLEVVGDIFFKKWATENRTLLLSIGLLIYFLGTVLWAFSLKYEDLSKAGAFFTIANLILVVLAGVFLFGEELTLTQKAGILLGVVSIALIEFS